jgi:tripartite-type tricarboxylate transporter receptor subunit TctC
VAANANAVEAYPNRPIKLIVGWAPGGATDTNARLLAHELGEYLKQPVIVDNKPGAGGAIGGSAVARAAPDGYTLAYIASSDVITSLLIKYPSYRKGGDLEPVSLVAAEPLIWLVGRSTPVRNFSEFLAYAKAKAGALNYATTGKGGLLHLAAAAFLQDLGIEATDIPYKGTAPAMAALISGQVQFFFGTFSDALPFVRDGRVNALAVAAESRSPLLPNVPTLTELLGKPNPERGTWQAVLAPKGTPQAIVDQLSKAIEAVIHRPSFSETLSKRGVIPIGAGPAALEGRIAGELQRRGKLIKALGIPAK